MSSLKEQLNEFTEQVKQLKALKASLRTDIAAWENTLKGKSELTDAQKKTLRSNLSSAKRQLGLSKKAD